MPSAAVVAIGLSVLGGAGAVIQLTRAAAAEMFPPERRARGMSIVLFGVVSGAVWGPVVFGPMFGNRALTPHQLVVPWIAAGAFTLAGLAVSFGVRPDPKVISERYGTELAAGAAASLREIVRRPGVPTAMLAAISSFAVMVGVMNLAGYVAVGHGHSHGAIFTIISLHIVGMYGLVLVIGDVVERLGRRRAMVIGLAVMAVSNAALVWLHSIAGMSLSLFGLGLGWSLSYVAASTELIGLAAPSERGRLVGATDLASGFAGALLALGGGVVYADAGNASLALTSAGLALLPAAWILGSAASVPPRAARAEV
jgi:MFS family permease